MFQSPVGISVSIYQYINPPARNIQHPERNYCQVFSHLNGGSIQSTGKQFYNYTDNSDFLTQPGNIY